jgi:hypothetical protein
MEMIETEEARIEGAIKLQANDDIATNMELYWSDDYPENEGYFSEWDVFFDAWKCSGHKPDEKRPKFVWGTTWHQIEMDASDIVERAIEDSDLHEGANHAISEQSFVELQRFLDGWCSRQTGTRSYCYDHKYAIEIPWEDYESEADRRRRKAANLERVENEPPEGDK